MYMTDASLNTTPFLDNLFMAIPRTSRKSSSDHYQCKQCMLEIFVFGRHTKNCKYSFSEQNLFNCLSDGNTILEAVGKLAFPVRRNGIEDDSYSVYSELNSNILKGKTITKNELTNIYASTFRKLEALIKRDRLVEMMKHRNQAENTKHKQIDFTQNGTDKAIQLDRNSSVHALNDFCVQFTSMSAPSISRSIQFNQNSKTESKWYDTFLMCFGIKANEDCKIDEETLATRLHGISSIEISKYLKI
ncbi:uncharacterized protein LOC143200768 [Rhynchophorus ferrugineus]|uniref:uncharacterized protein LOC143200768 n=1 Tax=Rhynchophorus ferrugineus TaxID=354439 RepID=UPI003FCEC1BB